jgi:hypothetical protein
MRLVGAGAYIAAAAAAALLSACVPAGDDDLVFSIEQALITSPDGATFDRAVPVPWDRLCVFTRYATLAQVDSVVGSVAATRDAAATPLDTYALLAFMDGGRAAARVRYPREKGEFAAPGPPHWFCLDRADAIFQMRYPIEGGTPWIGPVDRVR